MLFGDMDIARLLVYVHKVEDEKLRYRKEFRNKRSNKCNQYGKQPNNVNQSSSQKRIKKNSLLHLLVHLHSETKVSTIIRIYSTSSKHAHSQGSVVHSGNWDPSCTKCGITHLGNYSDNSTGCFKCG